MVGGFEIPKIVKCLICGFTSDSCCVSVHAERMHPAEFKAFLDSDCTLVLAEEVVLCQK